MSNDLYQVIFCLCCQLLHPPRLHEWSVWFLLQWYWRKWKEYLRQVLCHVLFSLILSPFPASFTFLYLPLSFLSFLIFLSYLFHCPNFCYVCKWCPLAVFLLSIHPKQCNQTLFLSKDYSLPKICEKIRKKEIERSLLLFQLGIQIELMHIKLQSWNWKTLWKED